MLASADERDTRGLTSTMRYSPSFQANWMLQPPSMPSARMILMAAERSVWWSDVGQRLGRRNDDGLARVDAHRVDVLHVTDGDARVAGVPHDLVLELLPAEDALLDENLVDAGALEAAFGDVLELLDGVGDAAAGAP